MDWMLRTRPDAARAAVVKNSDLLAHNGPELPLRVAAFTKAISRDIYLGEYKRDWEIAWAYIRDVLAQTLLFRPDLVAP